MKGPYTQGQTLLRTLSAILDAKLCILDVQALESSGLRTARHGSILIQTFLGYDKKPEFCWFQKKNIFQTVFTGDAHLSIPN